MKVEHTAKISSIALVALLRKHLNVPAEAIITLNAEQAHAQSDLRSITVKWSTHEGDDESQFEGGGYR